MKIEERRFKPNIDVVDTILGEDEAALMHMETKLSYALNRTGIKIWGFLKEGCTVDEIVEGLHAEFEVERENARKGAIAFIEDLLAYKLIVAVE